MKLLNCFFSSRCFKALGLLFLILITVSYFVSPVLAQSCRGGGCNQECKVCLGKNQCVWVPRTNDPGEGSPPGKCPYCEVDTDCTDDDYYSSGVPRLPSTFWGSVEKCGTDAPVGAAVRATVCGVSFSTSVVQWEGGWWGPAGSYYSVDVGGDIACTDTLEGGVNGDWVAFYVENTGTGQGGTFEDASSARLDLVYCPPSATIQGRVFWDKNGNGMRDVGEELVDVPGVNFWVSSDLEPGNRPRSR